MLSMRALYPHETSEMGDGLRHKIGKQVFSSVSSYCHISFTSLFKPSQLGGDHLNCPVLAAYFPPPLPTFQILLYGGSSLQIDLPLVLSTSACVIQGNNAPDIASFTRAMTVFAGVLLNESPVSD